MLPERKVWVFDGSIAQYASNYLTTAHGVRPCASCHGGDATASTRATAHTGSFRRTPGADVCTLCHPAITASSASSLHTTLGGYVKALSDRGYSFTADSESRARFDEQCTKCHVANEAGSPACGFCHVAVPVTAGGGFLNGHNFRRTPDMERNCTACHGSRVKDEFFGSNGALTARNGLGQPAPQPDVHFAKTQETNDVGLKKGCTFCHSGAEMHGTGAPVPAGTGDRYAVSTAPSCSTADCHPNVLQAGSFTHSAAHLEGMSCHGCHAQPYKNCFGCHTNLTDLGVAYYNINEGDPTLDARRVTTPTAAPDALMSLRLGRNPRADRPYKFAPLRHVPVDQDTFLYGIDPLPGLIPDMAALPTWKYATPHNIQRSSQQASACVNCHSESAFGSFWLTDPVLNAEGWVQEPYEAEEDAANGGVRQSLPLNFDTGN